MPWKPDKLCIVVVEQYPEAMRPTLSDDFVTSLRVYNYRTKQSFAGLKT